MSALPWIAAGVGAVAVGAAFLYRRSQDQAPTGPPADPCDKLPTQQLRDACKAIKTGLAIVDAVIPDTSNTTNVRLNGPVVESLPVAVANFRRIRNASGTSNPKPEVTVLKAPHTTKYQNGCVPIPGHPDFGKCAAGTESMISDVWFSEVGFAAGFSPSAVLTGDQRRDPLTFTWPPNVPWPGPPGGAPYVSPENPGTRYVYKGQYLICPSGTRLASGTDHRTVAGPPCVAATSSPTAPPPVIAPDANGCISYRRADGTVVRDCRTGATPPPGATPLSTDTNYRSDPLR